MTNTQSINILKLKAGNTVHFYGARFLVNSIEIVQGVMTSKATWLDGYECGSYFGKACNDAGKYWNFQGNSNRFIDIE